MGSNGWTVALVVVGVVVVAVATVLIVRHVRYVGALRARGWSYDGSPDLSTVLAHRAPPFGLGFDRETDQRVTGTTGDGTEFAVFTYGYARGGPGFDGRVASLRLPVALPPLFVAARTRAEVRGVLLDLAGLPAGTEVVAEEPDAALALLTPAVLTAIGALGPGADLSVDGDRLVAVGVPRQPDELAPVLDGLARVVRAVDVAAVTPYVLPTPRVGYHFYGRPDWSYVGADDRLVRHFDVDRGGHSHEAVDVIHAGNDGLPLDAFEHRWKTTHTRTVSNGNGGTRTETYTKNHSEPVLVASLPFAFGYLSLNAGWSLGGPPKVRFESEPFNDAYAVRAHDARFASDVIHPRMMELITAWRPLPFELDGTRVRFEAGEHDPRTVAHTADFLHAFFGRVQSFVWQNLGISPPPFRSSTP